MKEKIIEWLLNDRPHYLTNCLINSDEVIALIQVKFECDVITARDSYYQALMSREY